MLALLGEGWGAAPVRGELGVASATTTTTGRQPAVAVVCEVGEEFAGVHVGDHGAFRHEHLEVFATPAVEVFTLAVHAVLRPAVRVVAECQQRGHVAVGDEPDVAALATVAAVGTTEGHRAFAAERHTASSAVASAYVQLRFVDKPAHRTL